MYGTKWRTSERKFRVLVEKDVKFNMPDGTKLNAFVFRPEDKGKFPAIVSAHNYSMDGSVAPIRPAAMSGAKNLQEMKDRAIMSRLLHSQEVGWTNGSLEAGDPYFYARRGYAHVVVNVRGTGGSEGKWDNLGKVETHDISEVIEQTAKLPWCNGNVGMFGVSYLAMIQIPVAALKPPHLKCIFAPWAATDLYRDFYYHGGIFSAKFSIDWAKTSLMYADAKPENHSRKEMGEENYAKAIRAALANDEIRRVPELVEALENPDKGHNPYLVDLVLHPYYDRFWEERTPKFEDISVPCYIGADWGNYEMHLPGAIRSWERIRAKKWMLMGSRAYLDRPLYQLQYLSLRWFDHWLKGVDTGIEAEPPIRMFDSHTGRWKEASEWPLPQTQWTPFYLHEGGLLSERDHFVNEGSTSFFDSPWGRDRVEFWSPPFLEETEMFGPLSFNFYASTTDNDVFWFVALIERDRNGKDLSVSRGWLKGTLRSVVPEKSKPWAPYHEFDKPEPLEPNKIYEFNIGMILGNVFHPGSRLGLRINDDNPINYEGATLREENVGTGLLKRQSSSRITLQHNEDYPSNLLLPITSGNVLGTFVSGGAPYTFA